MSTITPNWSDKVTIVTGQKLANGALVRGTFSLNGTFGGRVFIRCGRLTATAPATGVIIKMRNLLYDASNARDIPHSSEIARFQDTTTAANLTTISALTAGPPGSFTLASATGFAADQLVLLVDSASSPTRGEFQRTSKIASTTLTLDRGYANIASGDTITNFAITFGPIGMSGTPNSGDVELIFDYGQEANTSPLWVEAWGQVLTSYTAV